jgi:CheY-like chemotaxis protein
MTLQLDHNTNPQRHRILVVEDNVLNQKLVVFMLQSRGFETDVCSDGKDAVEKLRNKKFDLVLMDIEMPEMNGYEATERIRHELRLDVPIIALTAHASEGEREKCLNHGMSDYLAKPFKGEEFYHIIRSRLAGEIEHTDIHS